MTVYVNVLEEWDDTVCGDWESPESNQLLVYDWLEEQPKNSVDPQIRALINSAYSNIHTFMDFFKAFLNIHWYNSHVNLSIFKNPLLLNPAESFYNSLNLLYWQKEFLEKEIPYIFDLGLLRVDCSNLKNNITPSPSKLIS